MPTLAPGAHAKMYALAHVARAGATRAGYVSAMVFIRYGGVQYGWHPDTAHGTLIGSLSITPALDETPDVCRFTLNGTVPSIGDEVIVTLGSINNTTRLFAGFGLTVTQRYVGKPANVQADVAAVDYTWQLGFVLVTAQYRNQSASAIVRDLVTRYAGGDGFTAAHVAADLPVLDEITFTNEDLPAAITRTVRRAGAYWYCDYHRDVHAFLTEPGNEPEPLTPAHRSLRDLAIATERTQSLTRVSVEGRGSRLLGDVAAGDTMVPLEAVEMFDPPAGDVFAKASFQGAEGGAQHLDYTGIVDGGRGTVVGPGIGPASQLTASPVPGTGVDPGTHGYAYTFVTASGESLPSPVALATVGSVANPTASSSAPYHGGPTFLTSGPGAIAIGDTLQVAYAYSTAATDTEAFAGDQSTLAWNYPGTITTISGAPLNPGHTQVVLVDLPYTANPAVKWIVAYFYASSKLYWMRSAVYPNDPTAPAGDTVQVAYAYYGANTGTPAANTATTGHVALTNIATGGPGTTKRRIYRTPAGVVQLKWLAEITNVGDSYLDTAADAALGANVPTIDSSGLTQPDGQVLPGSSTLPVAGASAFQAAGGWAIIGNGDQVIRYTGVASGPNALTGIPAPPAVGAITATVVYNSTVTAAPMLVGIPATGPRSIIRPLTAGDELYLVVQIDDPVNQAALAADVGGAGIREEWVQDRRLSIAEARARGRATLALRPLDARSIAYRCRDLRTAIGKLVTANLPAPTNLTGTFRIQALTIDNFRPRPDQYPTFTVQASNTLFSFDDWLRRMRTEN